MHKCAPHECKQEVTSELEAGTETQGEQNHATHTCSVGSYTEIDFKKNLLRSHVVAPYLWKWFQMLLMPFQIAAKLKFMEENQWKFYKKCEF